MFGLVWAWVDESDGSLFEQTVDWYRTKEELKEAYHNNRMRFIKHININRLILSPVVEYCWADIDRLF